MTQVAVFPQNNDTSSGFLNEILTLVAIFFLQINDTSSNFFTK